MKKRIVEFLSESNGKISCMRVSFLFWSFCLLGMWGVVSWENKRIEPIDSSIINVLMLLTGGKVVQRFGESNDKTEK